MINHQKVAHDCKVEEKSHVVFEIFLEIKVCTLCFAISLEIKLYCEGVQRFILNH